MPVELGRKGDYSVRAMLDLARHHGRGRQKSLEIAAEMDIPAKYLPQILAGLTGRGLLASVAGPDGGYSLARPPAAINLLEVIEASEGPVEASRCSLRGGPCDWERICPLHEAWSRGQDAHVAHLAATTFTELAAIDARIEAGTYLTTTSIWHRYPRKGQRSSPQDGG